MKSTFRWIKPHIQITMEMNRINQKTVGLPNMG
jgi:hypothetical protein